MDPEFRFADELGPAKMVFIHEPQSALKAVVAIDNVACGPSIGGVRMAPDVSAEEAFRLARAMTFKNAAAGLAHGGGKSVIFADPRMDLDAKERLIRAFARAIGDLHDYIPGPDMGTDESCMALDTGRDRPFGRVAARVRRHPARRDRRHGLRSCSCRRRGGEADETAPRRRARRGAGLSGPSGGMRRTFSPPRARSWSRPRTRTATVAGPKGLDLGALDALKAEGKGFDAYPGAKPLDRDAIVGIECDIWIPAARPDVVRADNVDRLKAKLVAQGANIPITFEAEQTLHRRGVVSIPDFIANAGGVICAAVEYHGGSQSAAFQTIEDKIRANTEAVLRDAARHGMPPRQAAVSLAERRVRAAMALRRH